MRVSRYLDLYLVQSDLDVGTHLVPSFSCSTNKLLKDSVFEHLLALAWVPKFLYPEKAKSSFLYLGADARGQHDLVVLRLGGQDRRDLRGRLAAPEHDLGEARALRAPAVHLRKVQHLHRSRVLGT